MSPEGGELFIVDNSDEGWTGLRYLRDWTEIAKSFDIATGFFEIGSLLGLDGNWQQLDKIRILMGAEVTHATKAAFLKATKERAEERLDASIEDEKRTEPFLHGVPAIVEALRLKQIECRVYTKDKFHAKAYMTHAKLDVVGPRALVGSSNFTRPGLTQNVELNIQVQTGPNVALLQRWFDEHWKQAQDVTPEILEVIERHVREYSPFQVYAKALHEFFRGHEITAGEWDQARSEMFPMLDRYQQEAYWSLMKIARQHGGAFLCDGVGLGKTFVGLMLIERLVMHEGKRVVLFAPKATKEAVWEPLIRHYLPHIGGLDGGDFSNLAVFSHTDLGRGVPFPARFARIAELADAVIIDEAHHFRNPGRAGTEDKESRYRKLFNLLDPEVRPKSLFLFTATPINNRLTDFRHMTELFSRGDDRYFARTLGINNLRAHFGNLEKELRREFDEHDVAEAGVVAEAEEILATSPTFQGLVVQRSRAYAMASQLQETGAAAMFPERESPRVAEYSIKKTYGRLLDDVEEAFARAKPLFALAIYYPLAYYQGPDESIDPVEKNRQYQVVGLIRTNFLKRFESSVWAFERSCDRLLEKLLAFAQVHSETDAEKRRLERWKDQNAEILGYASQLTLSFEDDPDDEPDEDVVPQELLDKVVKLDRGEYKVDEILDETFLDLAQIVKFLEETRKFDAKHDDKLQKLSRLLKSKELATRKVLIFSEFSDTARYLAKHLSEADIDGLEQIDSGTKKSRADVITRFSPYYNGASSAELQAQGTSEIRVLISTDVLSEGLNLQDATRMINSAQGVRDENVFDIQQGVAIAVAYRIDTRGTGRLEYGELLGSRSDKYQALHDESLPIEFVRLAPGEPDYLFVWRDETLAAEYEGGLAVDEMFVLSSSGVKTNRDGLTVAFTQDELDLRMDVFTDAELTSTEVSTALSVEDKKYWTVAQARSEVSRESWLASCADIHYRPFDIRRIVYHPSLVFSPRKPVMSQLMGQDNIALLLCRQQIVPGFAHVFVTRTMFDCCVVSNRSRENTSGFPLYRVGENGDTATLLQSGRTTNLTQEALASFIRIPGTPTDQALSESVLRYAYAVLHSPEYRARYAAFLRRDFPRLPIPRRGELFEKLVQLGDALVGVHLLETIHAGNALVEYTGPRNPEVGRVAWRDETVWLDAPAGTRATGPGTIGFTGVPKPCWDFRLGSYQVCEKWMKDRKGRRLLDDDIAHYRTIVVAITETIRLMAEIDEVIEEHDGWPNAFVISPNGGDG